MAVTISTTLYNSSPSSYSTGIINFSQTYASLDWNVLTALHAQNRLGSINVIDARPYSMYVYASTFNDRYEIFNKFNWSAGLYLQIGNSTGELTAAAASSYAAAHLSSTTVAIRDTSANIIAKLGSLQTLCSTTTINNIYFDDVGASLALTSAQLSSGSAVLGKVRSTYSIDLTGSVTAAIAVGSISSHITGTIAVSDTSTNVITNFSGLLGLGSRLGSVVVSGAMSLSEAQISTNYQVLRKISSPFDLTITAAILNVQIGNLVEFNIRTLHLTDSGTISLSYSGGLFSYYYPLINKLDNPYTITVTSSISVDAAMSAAARGHLSSFTVRDVASNLSGKIASWNSLSGYKPTSISLADASTPTISMSAADLAAYGSAYSTHILSKVVGSYNIAFTDVGNVLITIPYSTFTNATAYSQNITTPHSFALTGLTAANAQSLLGRDDISSIRVSDTANNIVANLAALSAWGNKLTALVDSNFAILRPSSADFNLYADTLSLITRTWNVGVALADNGAITAAASATSAASQLAGPISIEDTSQNILNILVAGQSGQTVWRGISLYYNNNLQSISFTDTNPLITLNASTNALGVFGDLIAPLIPAGTQYRIAFSSVMSEGNLSYYFNHPDFLSHFDPFSLVFNTGADFSAYVDQLMALGSQFLGIDVAPNATGMPQINITAAQYNSALMAKVNSNYALLLSHATVSQAISIANLDNHLVSVAVIDTAQNFILQHSALQNLSGRFSGITISDTADHVLNYLSELNAYANEIISIEITGGSTFAIAQSAMSAYAAVLNKISGGYTVVQSQGSSMSVATFLANLSNPQLTGVELGDSTSEIAAHLDELQAVVGRISSIRLTDANPLLLTSDQLNNNFSTLGKISVPYTFNLIQNDGITVEAALSSAFTHFSGRPAAASIFDTTAHIQANFDLLQAMASKLGNIYVNDGALFEINSYQLSHNTLLYSLYGADRVLGHLSLYVNDASASVATAVATTGYANLPITNVRVVDSGQNIGSAINHLLSLRSTNKLMGIVVSDGAPIPIEYLQYQSIVNTGFLSDIESSYSLKIQSVSVANAWATHNIWNVSAVTIYDSKANILANLNTLNSLGNELAGVTFSDVSAANPLVLSAIQFANYQNIWQYVTNITVSDTPANIATYLDTLAAHVNEIKTPTQTIVNGQNQLSGGIVLTGGSTLTLSGSQLVNDIEALKKISSSYSIIGTAFTKETVTAISTDDELAEIATHIQSYSFRDVPSNIRSSLDLLQAQINKVSSVTILGSDPTNIYFNQLTTAADVIDKITGPYTFNVQRVAVADVVATLALTHVTSVEINDTADNISANIELLESLGSGILSIHVINAEPLTISSDQETANAATLAKLVNSSPEAHSKNFALHFEESVALSINDFGFSDPDFGDSLQKVKITAFPTPLGTLKLNNQVVHVGDEIDVAEISAGHLIYKAPGYTYAVVHPQISFQASDGAVYSATSEFSFDLSSAPSSGPITPTPTATFAIPVQAITSIGLSPDGLYLIIKIGGVTSVVGRGQSLGFSDNTLSTEELTSHVTPIPVFKSSGGTGGYALPEIFSGPASLGLKYQLIESADNAVVTGSSDNDFIKVASANSIGKAVNGGGGNDVIDGGVGSTFVTGGANHNSTFFLDGRAPGVSWSTITDFRAGVDKATIWGFVKGVSSVDTSFTNYNNEGAGGYQGLTLHFKNLLPDGQTSGSNPNLNSITLTGHTLQAFGASSLADLNNQINNGTNAHFIVGATNDSLGTHSYLFVS